MLSSHRLGLASLVAAATAATAALVLAPTALAGGPNFDAAIARTVYFAGFETFNQTGVDQTVTQGKTPIGVTRYFAVQIASFNDDNYFLVDGCESTPKFKVKYFQEFSDDTFQNVTTAVVNGTHTTGLTDALESAYLEMQIKPTKNAKPGNAYSCGIAVDSVPDMSIPGYDVVIGRVEVKG